MRLFLAGTAVLLLGLSGYLLHDGHLQRGRNEAQRDLAISLVLDAELLLSLYTEALEEDEMEKARKLTEIMLESYLERLSILESDLGVEFDITDRLGGFRGSSTVGVNSAPIPDRKIVPPKEGMIDR